MLKWLLFEWFAASWGRGTRMVFGRTTSSCILHNRTTIVFTTITTVELRLRLLLQMAAQPFRQCQQQSSTFSCALANGCCYCCQWSQYTTSVPMADAAHAPLCRVQHWQCKYYEISVSRRLYRKVCEDVAVLESSVRLISYRIRNEGKLNFLISVVLGRVHD